MAEAGPFSEPFPEVPSLGMSQDEETLKYMGRCAAALEAGVHTLQGIRSELADIRLSLHGPTRVDMVMVGGKTIDYGDPIPVNVKTEAL